jgi:hypothetical protein
MSNAITMNGNFGDAGFITSVFEDVAAGLTGFVRRAKPAFRAAMLGALAIVTLAMEKADAKSVIAAAESTRVTINAAVTPVRSAVVNIDPQPSRPGRGLHVISGPGPQPT